MKEIKKIISGRLRTITLSVVIVLLITLLFSQILAEQNQAQQAAEERFEQIRHIAEENKAELALVEEERKQSYLDNAKLIAHMVDENPSIMGDTEELRAIAYHMGIDEIYFFDETGMIYAGTTPQHNGLTMDDGEQIAFFKPMLKDKSLYLCQDIMPNTYDGTMMQYAAVWNAGDDFIVQVGKNAENDLRVTEKYQMSHIFSVLRADPNANLYAIDEETGEIIASTFSDDVGKNMEEIGLDEERLKAKSKGFHARVDGIGSYCIFTNMDGMLIGRILPNKDIYSEVVAKSIELSIYMLALALILILLTAKGIDNIVIKNIAELNAKLRAITEGDLEQRVELRNSLEFSELSDHVNDMVTTMNEKLMNEYQYEAELTEALRLANAANKSKTSFLFNMSHDIRTPMNAILGFASVAEKHIDDKARVLDCLNKLNSAGEHLLRLINDVLDMAQIEGGKIQLDPQPHSIPGAMLSAEAVFAVDMEKKGLNFSISWDIEDEIVFVDALRMEQIELNLISNALKYTPPGGTITYNVTQIGKSEDGYATYRGVVKDTGVGMSKEFCNHVFEPFEREQTSTANGIPGTGLGLAITKSILDQMGGTISCTSEPGVGTEFEFTVRFKVASQEDLHHDEEEDGLMSDFSNRRILLVEDNELNAEIACEILTEFGFEVETAEDGAIAVDKVSQASAGYYDLILMDIQMPNMDGYEATRAIRKLSNPDLANIPIIACTANAFERDKSNAYMAGMNGHLSKPIDVSKLLETLAEFL